MVQFMLSTQFGDDVYRIVGDCSICGWWSIRRLLPDDSNSIIITLANSYHILRDKIEKNVCGLFMAIITF